jgi:hypothetical protein
MKEKIQEWLQLAPNGKSFAGIEHSSDQPNNRIDSFWRTLICNRAEPLYRIDEEWYRSMLDIVRGASAVPDDYSLGLALAEEERFQDTWLRF